MSIKLSTKVTEIQMIYNNEVRAKDRPQVLNADDAYQVLQSNWSPQIGFVEEFNILLLDRQLRALGMCQISKGGISSTVVDLRVAFAAAIKSHASSMILAHNHPSENVNPSEADIKLTERFKKAGEILDIKIVDHIILSPDGNYYSFSEEYKI